MEKINNDERKSRIFRYYYRRLKLISVCENEKYMHVEILKAEIYKNVILL